MHDIEMFASIGDKVKASQIKEALSKAAGSEDSAITARIDSEGGEVFEGFSIYSAFQAYEGAKECVIESAAFSIASYIAMAFDRVSITKNGYLMIHNPSTVVQGEEKDLRKQAELLSKIKASMVDAYASKSGIPAETIEKMMAEETFLNAEEALAAGFVDEIVDYSTPSRVEARQVESMPFCVVASLNVATPGESVSNDLEEPKEMAESIKVTIKDIKAKFPKAGSDFIVKAMEEEMTMEEITEELMSSLQAENEELKAKLSAMEEQMAKAEGDEEPKAMEEEEPTAMEEEEPKVVAKSGVKPVARVAGSPGIKAARIEWKEKLEAAKAKGLPHAKAVTRVNKENPGLRERMLTEASV